VAVNTTGTKGLLRVYHTKVFQNWYESRMPIEWGLQTHVVSRRSWKRRRKQKYLLGVPPL